MPGASLLINNNNDDFLSDEKLAEWLQHRINQKDGVIYASAGYLCKVGIYEEGAPLRLADPDQLSKKHLKKIAKRKLLFHVQLSDKDITASHSVNLAWAKHAIESAPAVESLVATRAGLLGRTSGRGIDISPKTAQKVWADAGCRCMFEGCGADLSEIPLWGSARIGYLAHIIASDPNGPRGTQLDSHRLADAPENIMLMCDAHHRLIDVFAPQQYPAAILNEMRIRHRDTVRSYLDSLAFPKVRAITLHANLAQVPTYFHDSDFIEAILATRRSMHPGVIHYVRRTSNRDDRARPDFWSEYLHEHELHIRQVIAAFNSATGSSMENIAVFPLHHNPTMVLAGRIMGEAHGLQVFQYNRSLKSWRWHPDSKAQPPGFFSISDLPKNPSQEAVISLELTANIDENAIQPDLLSSIKSGQTPWIRLRAQVPRFDCISHPEDIVQFTGVARNAINYVQDTLRAKKVHLLLISPACAVFSFGQMLQAGHHPEYIIYDRPSGEHHFLPAFSLTGNEVSSVNGARVSIPLR